MGDLKNGRTVHSLVRLLSLFPNVKIVYVSPEQLAMPTEIIQEIHALGVEQITSLSLEEAISATDVLYATRIQKERFASLEEYEKVAGSYCVDAALLMKVGDHISVAIYHSIVVVSQTMTWHGVLLVLCRLSCDCELRLWTAL